MQPRKHETHHEEHESRATKDTKPTKDTKKDWPEALSHRDFERTLRDLTTHLCPDGSVVKKNSRVCAQSPAIIPASCLPARRPSAAAPSMKPWKSIDVCSPQNSTPFCRTRSEPPNVVYCPTL